MNLFELPQEVHEAQALDLYRRFLAITGATYWSKRLDSLRTVLADDFKRQFHQDAFPLERAMIGAQTSLVRFGNLPPVQSGNQYELMAFIANTVNVFDRLSESAKNRLRGRIIHGLKSDDGLTPLAFEMSIIGAMTARGCRIGFSDFETPGGFDFLAERMGFELEVECKTLSHDIGRRIKARAALDLYCRVKNQIQALLPRLRTGLVVKATVPDRLTTEIGVQSCLSRAITSALSTGHTHRDEVTGVSARIVDFDMTASPFDAKSSQALSRPALEEFVFRTTGERNREVVAFFRPLQAAVVLVLASEKGDNDVHEWLKEARASASRQFSKTRPGILCVHFDGLTNAQLLDLARDSVSGLAIGATRILENIDRAHLVSAVFFARLTQEPISVASQGITVPGAAYITHNPSHPLRHDERANLFAAQTIQ